MSQKTHADIGIIGAMKVEVETIKAAMTDTVTETVGGMTFVAGCLGDLRVVTVVCGIGKVFAAMCAEAMILRYAPDVLINTGVAGTLTDRLSVGQVALASLTVQHDMDTSPLGDPVGMISGINRIHLPTDPDVTARLAAAVQKEHVPYVRGIIASGDRFMADSGEKRRIHDTFGTDETEVIACDMESAAIAQVCLMHRVPCGILRAISDGGDEAALTDYPTFLASAARLAARIIRNFCGQ